MCGKNSSVGSTLTATPAASTGGIQSGTPAMPADLPVATICQTPTGPADWILTSSLRQARARQQAEQRVERRVLIRHHRDGLALEIGGLLDAGIRAHDELHEALAAEHRDDLHRHAVLPDDDRRVRDDAAERHIAGADLLGDIDAAAADRDSSRRDPACEK